MKSMLNGMLLVLSVSSAHAQQLSFSPQSSVFGPEPAPGFYTGLAGGTPVDPSRTFIVATATSQNPAYGTPQPFGYISVGDLISASQSGQQQMSGALVGIAARLDRLSDRFNEGIALAGSINVLPPNPGDRFAVSFSGAGYAGAGAGSVAVSARLDESTLAYVGVARGATQTLIKGGVGFSFR